MVTTATISGALVFLASLGVGAFVPTVVPRHYHRAAFFVCATMIGLAGLVLGFWPYIQSIGAFGRTVLFAVSTIVAALAIGGGLIWLCQLFTEVRPKESPDFASRTEREQPHRTKELKAAEAVVQAFEKLLEVGRRPIRCESKFGGGTPQMDREL